MKRNMYLLYGLRYLHHLPLAASGSGLLRRYLLKYKQVCHYALCTDSCENVHSTLYQPSSSTSIHPSKLRLAEAAQLEKEGHMCQSDPIHPSMSFPSDEASQNENQSRKRCQQNNSYRPKMDAKRTTIFLFSGQGSQTVGMGRELLQYPQVENMYLVASDILGYDLLDICLNGSTDKLQNTVYCQPAILVTSLAAVEKLKCTQPWAIESCISTAGFSVGEYAALVFTGAMTFEDAVRVVKVRAEEMQKASQDVAGGMMTVLLNHQSELKLACHTAIQYCSKELHITEPVCQIANYLYPECKVIAGNIEALNFVEENAKQFRLQRTTYLAVSGAFHTELMSSAGKPLAEILSKIPVKTPIVPVHSNVNSFKYKHPKSIVHLLTEQIHKPVKWEQIMHVLYTRGPGQEFPSTYELGPGRQLGLILSKVNKKAYQHYESVAV